MARTKAKSVAITVAAGVLTFAVQELTAGDITTGAVGITVGLLLFAGYQYAEELDHTNAYEEIVDAVGEDTIKRLSEMTADELDALIQSHRREGR